MVAETEYVAESFVVTLINVSSASVAPPSGTPFLNHWRVGAGEPETATVNVTLAPVAADCVAAGCTVMEGASTCGPSPAEGSGGGDDGVGATGNGASARVSMTSRLFTVPAALVATAVLRRTGRKYGDRAYRCMLADLGHALENLRAAAAAGEAASSRCRRCACAP